MAGTSKAASECICLVYLALLLSYSNIILSDFDYCVEGSVPKKKKQKKR